MDLNEIHIFVKVVQTGSFSLAGRQLGTPKSTVSTKIRSLEERLGVSLLTRTTRKLKLTETGATYYERCVRSLEELQNAEAEASRSQNIAQGRLRVTAPIELGHVQLTRHLDRFVRENPGIQLDLILTDEVLDLVAAGVDVAIRAGALEDSSLRARKLGESVFQLFASPKYLRRAGTPKTIADLANHRCLHFSTLSPKGEWDLRRGSERKRIAVQGPIVSNHLIQLKDLTLEGAGILLMPSFLGEDEVRRGQLVRVLPDWYSARSAVHIVYPQQSFIPPKVEHFVRYLVENFHLSDAANSNK
jgi:DNA-binding transcriptional LysR family regulator